MSTTDNDDLNRELLRERFSRRPSWSLNPPPHGLPVDPHDVEVDPDDDIITARRCRDLHEAAGSHAEPDDVKPRAAS